MFGSAAGGCRVRNVFLGVVAAAVLGAGAPAAQAAVTRTVDDDKVQCPAAAYTTIQAAVDAAGPGDTVSVCRGIYNQGVYIGAGKNNVRIWSSTAPGAAVVRGVVPFEAVGTMSGVSIERFRIEPDALGIGIFVGVGDGRSQLKLIRGNLIVGGMKGIIVANGDVETIRDNLLSGFTGTGLSVESGSLGGVTNALGNTFTAGPGSESRGIAYVSDGGLPLTGTVFGNTVSKAAHGMVVSGNARPDIKASTMFRNGSGITLASSGPSGGSVENNNVNNNTGDGISTSSTGWRFLSNNAKQNGGIDCKDTSTGSGTASTGNIWTGNYGLESSPVGICKP
jgi:hypothetical protein